MFEGINFWAVIVATLWSMVLGMLWYTKVLFGNTWMKLVGLKAEDIDPKDSYRGMIISVLTAFIAAWTLAWLMKATGTFGYWYGMRLGACISVGFIATTLFSNDAYDQRSVKLSLLNSGYRFFFFLGAGAIIGAWQ